MALNGSFYGSTNNSNIRPKITWQAVQSQAGNYSDVTAVLTYSRTNTGYTTSGTWSGSITIGDASASDSRYLQITYDSNTQAITHTVRVYHDEYGAASVTISATGAISGTTLEQTTISQRVTLDTIARATTIAATAAEIGQVSMIAVSRKHSAFSHSVAYSFGNLSGFIGPEGQCTSKEEKMTASSISFRIPAEFCYQIPNSPTGVCRLVCRTYNGNTLIGQRQTEFTVTAGQETFGPLVEGWVEDVNPKTLALTGNAGVLVRGFSTARCTLAAQARGGASLTQVSVNGTTVTGNSLLIAGIESGKVTFQATDSRGYTQKITVTKTLIPYVRLTCNPTVKRTDPTSGNCRVTIVGKYFSGSFGPEKNSLALSCRVNGGEWLPLTARLEGENDYAIEMEIGGLDYDRISTVEVTAEDALCRVVVSRTVPKGVPVFDWGEEDFSFHVPVSLMGGLGNIGKLIYPVGSIYMSVNATSPAELFGGTWQRLKDRFLLAAGDNYEPGKTGGKAEHMLTLEELPEHDHGYLDYWSTAPNEGAANKAVAVNGDGEGLGDVANGRSKTARAGGGKSHNNMPPYLAVYMWKRTA